MLDVYIRSIDVYTGVSLLTRVAWPLHRLWIKYPAYYLIIRRGSYIPDTQSRRRHSLLVCAGSLTREISALHSLWTSFPHSCIGLHVAPGRFEPYTVCDSADELPALQLLEECVNNGGFLECPFELSRLQRSPALGSA